MSMNHLDISERHLYLCTPIRNDLADFVSTCIEGGVDVVQLREKDATDREIYDGALKLAEVCRHYEVPLFINDRADIALGVDADGVHVGQDDIRIGDLRRVFGDRLLLGLSTHSQAEFDEGSRLDVSYLSVGPIVETPTKPGRPGTGVGYLDYATQRANKPVFITGGVTPSHIPTLIQHGATRFVVVRYLTESKDPHRAALELRKTIDTELPRSSAPSNP